MSNRTWVQLNEISHSSNPGIQNWEWKVAQSRLMKVASFL